MKFTHIPSTHMGAVPISPHVFTLTIDDRDIAFLVGFVLTYGLLRPRFVDSIGHAIGEWLRLGFCLYCLYLTMLCYVTMMM